MVYFQMLILPHKSRENQIWLLLFLLPVIFLHLLLPVILLSLLFWQQQWWRWWSFVVGPYQDTLGFGSCCSAQWVVCTLSADGKAEWGVHSSLKLNEMCPFGKGHVHLSSPTITGVNNSQDEILPWGYKREFFSEGAKHEVGHRPMFLMWIMHLLHLSASLSA